jgi:hypothetical protein
VSKPKLLLIGAGGHANSCIDVIEQLISCSNATQDERKALEVQRKRKADDEAVFKKAQDKIGFKAEVGVTQGIKEIYLALKSGKVDVGPKTVTVQWYRNILDAKELLNLISLDGRII